ncbi:MAG: hypothetical protein AB7J30_05415 [Hyphomicrobium sp.]|uniref:hypothetical protein n=1 Tax=Hyphomicrobium sp. TaxID=82 RepID=UPI003D0A85A7
MLDWLSRLFRRREVAQPQRPRSTSPVRVTQDDKLISVDDGSGNVTTLAWAEVGNVTVLTTNAGPFETDLFWMLSDRDGRHMMMVPMGAAGEHELLQAMQARLAGFDNMAVIEAMSSVENGVFQIWPAGELV